MSKTKIAWTEHTWNPVVGCSKVSPGCQNCYAERMAARQAAMACARIKGFVSPTKRQRRYVDVVNMMHDPKREKTYFKGWNGKTYCDEKALDIPLKRKKPTMYFVCSMGDLFHESVPFEFIAKVFKKAEFASWHTYQFLTKREDRLAKFVHDYEYWTGYEKPSKHIWLGVTAENQEMASKRIPILLQIKAAVRFVSIEPCLEDAMIIPLKGVCFKKGVIIEEPEIDWIIIGAESGPKARYCPVENIRSIVNQCKDAGVKCFVKQIHIGTPDKFKLIKNVEEFPESIRVREFPVDK